MITLLNITPLFDFANHGFVYLGQADDGNYWIRSVTGKWAVVSQKPLDMSSLQKDLFVFLQSNQPVTEDEIITDDAGKAIIPPTKQAVDVKLESASEIAIL